MEYRLVTNENGIKIYKEADTEHLYTITKHSHLFFRSKYLTKDADYLANQSFLLGKSWKISNGERQIASIKFRWLVGKKVKLYIGDEVYLPSQMGNTLLFREASTLRTGLIIDKERVSRGDHLIIEHEGLFSPIISWFVCIILLSKGWFD